ncbi:TraB/GumN family protein [Candidatus Woesearchaeota archaeon]|nr:TraB/GumN family protein [Candidatus Woesearchaeota archaeon]
MNYKNLVFLGTSHIAEQSLNDVKKFIEAGKPDIIALELDKKRLLALMQKQRKIEIRIIRKVGIKGFLFLLFGAWAEKKLGKLVGVAPGSEMKTAITLARKHGIKIFLIDRDIEVTLRRLSKVLTWKEKVNFIADIIKAVFTGKQEFEFDLRTVPEKSMIKKLVEKLKERYPNVHKVLIEERNLVIAENLKRLMAENTNDKILVILGAGHVDEVMRLVKRKNGIGLGYSFSV